MHPERQRKIRELFDDYIEMYAARDDRLTARFSQSVTGYSGSDSRLIRDREEWVRITRQDFAQVPGRIRIEMLDLALQDLCDDVVVATACFHIHLPSAVHQLAKEVARLVLVFRLEGADWLIAHCSYSIPYQSVQDGEVFPLQSLKEQNSALQALVAERTQALQESQDLYRLLTEDAQYVLWRTDSQLVLTYISPADERLRGFRADEVVGRHVFDMFNEEGVAVLKAMIARRVQEEASGTPVGFLNFEVQHRCKDGRRIWGEVLSKPERNAQGEIIGYHGITREITERKRLEEQVHQLAFYDPLTHLANRRLMLNHLEQAMSASKRSQRHGALLFLDLDNFKPLNDTHGHGVGDLLLIEVAERLKAWVREADTVARFGGDEFVVLQSELSTQPGEAAEQAVAIAEKARTRLAEPYVLQSAPSAPSIRHECTASIGVAVFRGRDESQNTVIDRADAAMYRAKEEGRNRIQCASGPAAAG
ncbi:diguanylate cyclase domain-containing protein [Acidovorax temperans]|uniref:diguanylate cyclase domain-containing protein n=1 Tax=Acidovorax temperans TaxID=80878 RepID=UPI00235A1B21|nr:diguanylate cyclase [Acidovorax temperans]WCT24363.1 diguanylate cyclase [Acidovorax temperans]